MFEYIISPNGLFLLLALFAIGACGSLVFQKIDSLANWWSNFFTLSGSLFGLVFSYGVLTHGAVPAFEIPTTFPFLSLVFRVDYLSAFFIFLISLISCACSLYAFGYVKQFYKKYNIGSLGFFYNVFIASLILVVTAQHALFFLIVWELMSLASYFLVIFEHDHQENVKAGSLYFVMTHIGTAFIICAFLLMYLVAGSFDFDVIKQHASLFSPVMQSAIFLCALVGFGVKAGIIPLHIWLPSAHPAAPSHVSALMSGVMIKMGLYMLVRICFDFFSPAPVWWGLVFLVLGSLSSLLGVLYALAEHDLKKLLAYHSIENIGIILLGFGSSLIFLSKGLVALAAIGFIAALYHTINHAIFKGLLFLGAGSVISQMHTRNIEHYGGLIKVMPVTAFFFLVGSLAISALPPLNGFVSEWLTFQSLFQGVGNFNIVTTMFFLLAIGALAFTGGLAAACFVKAFGITFLARPRSTKSSLAKESSMVMQLGMGLLAICTLLFGVAAAPIGDILRKITMSISGFAKTSLEPINFDLLNIGNNFASVSMPALFFTMMFFLIFLSTLVTILCKNRRVQNGRTWDCGSDLNARMEITATGFSRSLVVIFRSLLRPQRTTDVEYYDTKTKYFPIKSELTLELHDVYRSYIYNTFEKITRTISDQVKKIQTGNINGYIAYIFLALIILLLSLAL